jgi:hypothetical protein
LLLSALHLHSIVSEYALPLCDSTGQRHNRKLQPRLCDTPACTLA